MGEIIEFPVHRTKGAKKKLFCAAAMEDLDYEDEDIYLVEFWQCDCGSLDFRWEARRGLVCSACDSPQEEF